MKIGLQQRTRAVSLTLLSVLIAGACTGAPGAPGAAGKPGGVGKPEIAPISVGTGLVIRDVLAPTLSYSGNVQARSSVNLVPKISARLEKLHADVGDEVAAGQVIAELDHAQLDAQVQQAEAAVTAAQAKLDQTQASAKQEDIDAARAVVDQARARLEQAKAGGRPEEIAAARAAAEQAQARAEQVAAGAREEDRQALQAAVDQAEAQQDQLRAQLTTAQTSLAEAKYRLDQARAGQGGPGVRPEDIAQAQAVLDSSKAKLAQIKNPRPEDIRAAELQVEKAKADLDAAENARDNCGKTETVTRSSSTQRTSTGTTRSESTTRSRQSCSQAQKDQLDAQVESARVAVKLAETNLQKIKNPSPYDIQQAEQAVAQAEANLQKLKYGGTSDVAALELKVMQTQAEVDRLQSALDQATANVASAQAKLQAAINPDPNEVRQAVAAADQARANLARIANPDPYNVQSLQAALDQANAQLAGRLRPYTEEDIRAAAAGVDQAVAALESARVQAAEAIIRAPFDGTVSQKLLNPGAMASPQTPILALVSKDVEVVVQVEEARIGQIQKGQPATLTVSAYPGRQFPAVVSAIAPAADSRSRTFAVRVVPREQDGTLRDGMFAQVNIVGTGQPALLVPNEAIVTRAGRNLVFVVVDDRVQAREVKLGETDGRRTAVLEGNLQPNDEVVVTNPDTLTDGAPVIVEQRNIEPRGTSPGASPLQPSSPGAILPSVQASPSPAEGSR